MNVVTIRFRNGYKDYDYICPYPVKVNDSVVIDSPYEGYVVCRVNAVKKLVDSPKASKFVVQVVDEESYLDYKKKEKERVELQRKLDAKIKAFEKQAVFNLLLETDSEAREIVTQLNSL